MGITLDTGASKVSSAFRAGSTLRGASFAALPRARVFVRHLLVVQVVLSIRRPDRVNGPARVGGPRLRRRRPDTMALADVLRRIDRPGDPLGAPSVSGWRPVWAAPDAMRLAVGLTGTRAHLGCVAEDSGRPLMGLSAAIMPILSKNIGGDRPQYPVAKSIHFRHSAGRSVLATLAVDEAARRTEDMKPPG